MSDFIPKTSGVKVGGLSRKAQKLQAMREKAAAQEQGSGKTVQAAPAAIKAKGSLAGARKPTFQRKAV
jgi:hypothetical protein